MTSPALECRDVEVVYDREPVLTDLTLTVAADEVLALLGPSGSGKSTLLYTVAGFVQPSAGTVHVAGRAVASAARVVPPEDRDVGMVFQNYALWPHLTAVDTVAYPLRRGGLRTVEARRRAFELLDRLGLADLADRRPAELSGGQQQRVGVARALARDASLYLFDEPTAHLDTPLRAALAEELAQRRRAAGAAAVYATHDAGEALAVADRVALLRDGHLVQIGTPVEVYNRPVDLWAAGLTGTASVLEVSIERVDRDSTILWLAGRRIAVAGGDVTRATLTGRRRVLVRPDWTSLGGPLAGTVLQVWYRGAHTDYRLGIAAGHVDVRAAGTPCAVPGQEVTWGLRRVWMM